MRATDAAWAVVNRSRNAGVDPECVVMGRLAIDMFFREAMLYVNHLVHSTNNGGIALSFGPVRRATDDGRTRTVAVGPAVATFMGIPVERLEPRGLQGAMSMWAVAAIGPGGDIASAILIN